VTSSAEEPWLAAGPFRNTPAASGASAIMWVVTAALEQLLAGRPSLLAWRRLCVGLDALEGAALTDMLAQIELDCAAWPASVRPAPGRWLRDLLDGRVQPRLQVARAIDLTLCEVQIAGDRLAWTDASVLAAATIVRVLDDHLGDAGVRRWLGSANNLRVETLALATRIGDGGAELLAADLRREGVRSLALFLNDLGAAGITALLAASWPALRRLLLGRNRLGVAGARALAGATQIRELELLDLDCDRLNGAAIEQLITRSTAGPRVSCAAYAVNRLSSVESGLSGAMVGSIPCAARHDNEQPRRTSGGHLTRLRRT